MSDKHSRSPRSRKAATEASKIKKQLDQLDREWTSKREALEGQLFAKAVEAEQSESGANKAPKKRNSRKPKARSWKPGRPKIPYDGFPLTPHGSGKWQKKIRGKIHYFGNWARRENGKLVRVPGDGWKEALELYKAQADDLHAGRVPRESGEDTTVKHLCDRFYAAKLRKHEAAEITARTLDEYDTTCERIVKQFGRTRLVAGLTPADFEALRALLAKRYGPTRLGNEVQRVRTVFKYGYESGLIDVPVRFGPEFKKPPRHVILKHKAAGGRKVFTSDELRRLLGEAGVQVKAMILLGINCGFGNTDCGKLRRSAVDLKAGWIDYPRPKTGVQRRCPLWPETIKALKAALAKRPDPKSEDDADLVFVTKYGKPWVTGETWNPITQEMSKLLKSLKINGRRGLGFYSLRHTFRTVADATKDATAIRVIMGHADDSIDANYTHGVEDARLRAVADHVHTWLFPPKGKAEARSKARRRR